MKLNTIDYTKIQQDDLIKLAAMETDTDPEVVKYVIRQFWRRLRYFITNPLETKAGVKVQTFLKFRISERRINNFRENYMKRQTKFAKERVEFYDNLIEQLKKYNER